MPKNIVLCCDGTGNEIEANLSNVLKLYRIVRKTDEQVVYYDPGIGTISSNDPWSRVKSNALGVLGLLTGYGLDENLLDAYQFLIETYTEGDRVYLFGFSRGAYTIRVLAGFLRLIGLLAPAQKNLSAYALTAYKQAAEPMRSHSCSARYRAALARTRWALCSDVSPVIASAARYCC